MPRHPTEAEMPQETTHWQQVEKAQSQKQTMCNRQRRIQEVPS